MNRIIVALICVALIAYSIGETIGERLKDTTVAATTPAFVTITPEKGNMKWEMSSGVLMDGEEATVETYFVPFFKENNPFTDSSKRLNAKHDFLVINLKRTPADSNSVAYALLDSLNMIDGLLSRDTLSAYNNWTAADRAEMRRFAALQPGVETRFYNSVCIAVERSALETGVSDSAYLK